MSFSFKQTTIFIEKGTIKIINYYYYYDFIFININLHNLDYFIDMSASSRYKNNTIPKVPKKRRNDHNDTDDV